MLTNLSYQTMRKSRHSLIALPLVCGLISSCSDGGTTALGDSGSFKSEESSLIDDASMLTQATYTPEAAVLSEQATLASGLSDALAQTPESAEQVSDVAALEEQITIEQSPLDPLTLALPAAAQTLATPTLATPTPVEPTPVGPTPAEPKPAAPSPAAPSPAEALSVRDVEPLQTPDDLFQRDGYDSYEVIRVDLRTASSAGVCTEDDYSGCTLLDVNEDTNIYDNFKPEINVRFQADDYTDDGSVSNAELRQRGATARQSAQKSYRVKIDKGVTKWRNERRLQLNKHPTDLTRIRNKLSFDLMSNVSNLPSLRTQFVNLWIDDGQGPVDFGLFTHVEALQKEFLENRGWNEDDNLYKAEQFAFSLADLQALAIDESGAPLNEDAFEERLEVKTGEDDHTQLVAMLEAINDPGQNFESVLDRYFDRDNVLMWVTVNFLLAQKDITTHNFYLYNPAGSEKFFFIPWDYDASFYIESELANSFENPELNRRLFHGYARGANSVFLDHYFRIPGINDTIVNAANTLRAGPLSNTEISERAAQYASIVRPFITREPDATYLASSTGDVGSRFDARIEQLSGYVTTNHQLLQDGLSIPMPHTLQSPALVNGQWVFSWSPAHDVTGHTISYDIQISTDIAFSPDAIVFDFPGISQAADEVEYSVPASSLPDGQLFYRVVARSSRDPQQFWQVGKNILNVGGTNWYGVVSFEQ